MPARVMPAFIMIASASLRVSGLPKPPFTVSPRSICSTRSFVAFAWVAAFAAPASPSAIGRSTAAMTAL
jgi:hypothetical protein